MYLGHRFLVILCIAPLFNAGSVNTGSYDYDYNDWYDDNNHGEDISAKESPVIISKSKQFEIDRGGPIKLPCIVDNLPADIGIVWTKIDDYEKTLSDIAVDNLIIDPKYQDRASVVKDDEGSVLTINPSNYEDSGKYKCKLTIENNPPQIIHSVKIIPMTYMCKPSNFHADYWVNALESPPRVAAVKGFIYKDVGDKVEIVCEVAAVPVPKIDWLKDGQVLRSSSRKTFSQFGNEHTLTIYPIHTRDFGIYICKASNALGSEEQMIQLKGFDDSEAEEVMVEIGLSPSGNWESVKVVSSGRGPHPIIGMEPFSINHFSIKNIQKTKEGWVAIIVPYSPTATSSTIPLTSKFLLVFLCVIFLTLIF